MPPGWGSQAALCLQWVVFLSFCVHFLPSTSWSLCSLPYALNTKPGFQALVCNISWLRLLAFIVLETDFLCCLFFVVNGQLSIRLTEECMPSPCHRFFLHPNHNPWAMPCWIYFFNSLMTLLCCCAYTKSLDLISFRDWISYTLVWFFFFFFFCLLLLMGSVSVFFISFLLCDITR